MDPEIAAAVTAIARVLESLGHRVEPLASPAGSLEEFLPVYQRLAANPPALSERAFQPVTRWLREAGKRLSAADAIAANERLSARLLDWFGDLDLCLSPTVGRLPPRLGEWSHLPAEAQFRAAAELGAFTAAFNITGQPSASLPAGLSATGLPIGAMLTGRRGADLTLLRLCHQLEEELAWHRRLPPLDAA